VGGAHTSGVRNGDPHSEEEEGRGIGVKRIRERNVPSALHSLNTSSSVNQKRLDINRQSRAGIVNRAWA
jgi:hypothetical protein